MWPESLKLYIFGSKLLDPCWKFNKRYEFSSGETLWFIYTHTHTHTHTHTQDMCTHNQGIYWMPYSNVWDNFLLSIFNQFYINI